MTARLPVVVVLLGALAAAVLVDRALDDDDAVVAEPAVDASAFPIAADPAAFSSTWFCAGGTADADAFADHSVVVANPTDTAVAVTVTAYAGEVAEPLVTVDPEDLDATEDDSAGTEDGDEPEGDEGTDGDRESAGSTPPAPVTTSVDVGPLSRERVVLSQLVEAPVASALVESPVGGLVVEHEVVSVHGRDAKPCATSAASTWHFAWGDTTVAARELLVLFNPFPRDAIVDGRFSTEDGIREPGRFDGLVVPGRGTLAVDLGDDVTRRAEVAGTITTRSGRIVVDRIVRLNRELDRGLTVQLGVPVPQEVWVFPDGFVSDEVREEYVVYNPGGEVAEVSIDFVVDDPETHGIPAPVELSIAPGSHQRVDLRADGRVPSGVGHAAVVRSANRVPVVAERVLFSAREDRRGVTVTTGSPLEAERWTFAAGAADANHDEWLVLVNLDPRVIAEVDVVALAAGRRLEIADLQDVEIGPGQRLAIRLGEHLTRPELPLVVLATEPVVVERGYYRVGEDQRGMSNAVGVPSPGGLRVPPDPLVADGTGLDLGGTDDPAGGDGTDDEAPAAPDDVDLPEPDATIVIDDPDAEAEDPEGSTTTGPTSSTTAPDTATSSP